MAGLRLTTCAQWSWLPVIVAVMLASCHSAPFEESTGPGNGPASSGQVVRLTFNPGADYWPAWSQDGHGILYAYTRSTADSNRRCIGMLPPGGGTQIWHLCDDRSTELDSMSSFPAYAVGDDGRLLYVEATADTIRRSSLVSNTLWIADTAKPFLRTAVADLGPTGWLADLAWTGPSSFLGLRQTATFVANECFGVTCALPVDTLWSGVGVVTGTIGSSTLSPVGGTEGATSFSLAEGGRSIVFNANNNTTMLKVPVGGGVVVSLTTLPDGGGQGGTTRVMGISCVNTICVAAVSPVNLSGAAVGFARGTSTLYAFSTVSSTVQPVYATGTSLLASPMLSPLTGDIAVQVGGALGHIETAVFAPHSDLEYLTGLIACGCQSNALARTRTGVVP